LAEHDDRIWAPPENTDDTGDDFRDPFQVDRDRILYSSAFRRLAGVTQVVSATEGHVFHNRLTHSLEVAQIARRLAERLRAKFPDESASLDNVNADVVEAAALAHDLGHPPFGHVAEHELDRLVRKVGCLEDGYEGNAQAFRWVAKLSVRLDWQRRWRNTTNIEFKRGDYGLNLTRATLNAILKYPWLWRPDGKPSRNWGAFDTEKGELMWARELAQDVAGKEPVQSVEAAIMDWADDIAYSVHDTEDFYRAGLIPLERLANERDDERAAFLENVCNRFKRERRPISNQDRANYEQALNEFFFLAPIAERYSGSPAQRWSLRGFCSNKIDRLIAETKLSDNPVGPLDIPKNLRLQVKIAKQFVWEYVIENPSLATQQEGYRKIIEKLFWVYLDASNHGPSYWKVLPKRFRQNLEDWREDYDGDMPKARMVRNVVDTIASLTDHQAVTLCNRLTGVSPGSVADLLPS
jgi:dGTPase